ncbi:acyltransferase [Bifidobacterium sp. ESL0745]|uniref:acyltransferase family protein n=1 Tax=Bifidobacterium sp. ESL0745 TaxID=2983226 RepID=UPI0023F76F37|nr:acyltransferase [Bifidobacterium sp. ESL0745]MDF7665581.1 acyltransferase [Bifidobacterium sp. ESL0745]
MHQSKNHSTVSRRNSSIELLRIIAMLAILGHHLYVSGLGQAIETSANNVTRFLFQMTFLPGGWVGDILFFSISAWFIADEVPSLKKNVTRIWNLEREVLFWSITLFALSIFLKTKGVNPLPENTGWKVFLLKSLLPTSTRLWWYVTSYDLFLLFSPFIVSGLKRMKQRNHALLALITFGLWGVGTLFPLFTFDFAKLSVFTFIFWFILISYYRWYMKPLSTKTCWLMIISGEMIYLIFWVGSLFIPWLHSQQRFIFINTQLPPLLVSFGLFLLFERFHFSSKIINFIAPSTFAVYLIHQHSSIGNLLWQKVLVPTTILKNGHPFLFSCAAVIGLFVVFILADFIRRLFFHITIDRHKDKWLYQLLGSKNFNRIKQSFMKHTASSGNNSPLPSTQA